MHLTDLAIQDNVCCGVVATATTPNVQMLHGAYFQVAMNHASAAQDDQ